MTMDVLMFKKLTLILLFITFLPNHADATNQWDLLFDAPQFQDAKLSPDGKHLALIVLDKERRALVFIDTFTKAAVGTAKMHDKYEIGQFYWANNERVVFKMNVHKPWRKQSQYYGELFAVNLTGKKNKLIFSYKPGAISTGTRIARKERKSVFGWAEIIDLLPNEPEHILISSTPQNTAGDRSATIHKLNIYNGHLSRKLAGSPVSYANFITDNNGTLKVAVGVNRDNEQRLYLFKDNEWHPVSSNKFGDSFYPLTTDKSGNYLYTLDNYKQDIQGLFKLNLLTGEYQEVFTDKEMDITHALYTSDGNAIYGLRIDDGQPSYILLNKNLEQAKNFKDLLATFPGRTVNIRSQSDDGELVVVRVSSATEPGSMYLYNRSKKTLEIIFKYFPKLDSQELVQRTPIEFKASDGQTLHGYFTPGQLKDDSDRTAPLVMLVHGGPRARDYWSYDAQAQYLALNGYSVLQVNYRGSSGYGREFMDAGNERWGSRIQDDIYDAYQWAVANNKATANNACIMGASFGAYSAIQSVIRYPDTYKCAVANAGVYDLQLMFEEGDVPQKSYGESYLDEVLGNDEAKLKAMSPVNHVNKIKVPLFLAHGKKDERAPYEHAISLRKALKNANKQYTWFVKRREAHGFHDPENKKEYMENVLGFLNSHLMTK